MVTRFFKTLSLVIAALTVESTLADVCPNYAPGDFDNSSCAGSEKLSTASGPIVGGTVFNIDELSYCSSSHIETTSFYCRFEGESRTEIVPGYWFFTFLICPSPYWGQVEEVTVSYTAVEEEPAADGTPCDFDPDSANWKELEEKFTYNGYEVGVSVDGTSTSSLIAIDQTIDIKWSPQSLLLSAKEYLSYSSGSGDLSVEIEALALVNGGFEKIYSYTMPNENDDTFSPSIESLILPYLQNECGIEGLQVGVILVRVVAYLIIDYSGYYSTKEVVLATKSSDLIGVLPNGELQRDDLAGICPLSSRDDACDYESTEYCPPTYLIAENDDAFVDDKLCEWPTGNNACDQSFSILEEWYTTCKSVSYFDPGECDNFLVPGSSFSFAPLVGGDGCSCEVFRDGAAGCVRSESGSTQCCYSASGALITEVADGGGTVSCTPNDGRPAFLSEFLYDTLPKLYCCEANEDSCEDYYEKMASITSDDGTSYDFPERGLVTFGDPHLQTFDEVHFDFNGAGEYILFCGTTDNSQNLLGTDSKCDPSAVPQDDMISIHCQYQQLRNAHGGTVMTAIAIKHPLFASGSRYIVITNDLRVFAGSIPVPFPEKRSGLTEHALVGKDIIIKRTADLSKSKIIFRLFTPELNLKVVAESNVLTPTLIERPRVNVNSVGLAGVVGSAADFATRNLRDGTSDGRQLTSSSFFSSAGIPTTVAYEINNQNDKVVVATNVIQTIFTNFGTSWEVNDENSSLFGVLGNFPEVNVPFTPNFNYFDVDARRLVITEAEAIEKCEEITANAVVKRLVIKSACIYDMLATMDETLVTSMITVAKDEHLELETLIHNRPPQIQGDRNPTLTVLPNEEATFTITVLDDQDLTATFENSGSSRRKLNTEDFLFEILPSRSRNVFDVRFKGSSETGKFKAQIVISDGFTPVLFTAIADVKIESRPNCPNYRPQDFNISEGVPLCKRDESLKPESGPIVGGAVLEISGLSYCAYHDRFKDYRHPITTSFYCRFEGGSHMEIVPAFQFAMPYPSRVTRPRVSYEPSKYYYRDSIYCPTPYWGHAEDAVTVSYAAVTSDEHPCEEFDPLTANWNKLEQTYSYNSLDVGVNVHGTATSSLISLNQTVDIKWSPESLFISNLLPEWGNPKVEIQVLALNTTKISSYTSPFVIESSSTITSYASPFEKIYNETMENHTNDSSSLTLSYDDISPFLDNEWGIGDNSTVGVILVRVVSYYLDFVGRYVMSAAKSSDLIGVLPYDPQESVELKGECPWTAREQCNYDAPTEVCPPTYEQAKEDDAFQPDKFCPWPTGNNTCDESFSIMVEWYWSCYLYNFYEEDENAYCSSFDLDSPLVGDGDGCACERFRDGATGCFRSDSTQCCYSPSGALITEVADGGGSITCSSSDGRLAFVTEFLYDTMPLLYCCGASEESCDDYKAKVIPSFNETSYDPDELILFASGDPHLRTLGKVYYDFNGIGEYVMFCGTTDANKNIFDRPRIQSKCDPTSSSPDAEMVSVHALFEKNQPHHQGTVITAAAVKHPLYASGRQYIVITNDLKVYAGPNEVTFRPRTIRPNSKTYRYSLQGKQIFVNKIDYVRKPRVRFELIMPEIKLLVVVANGSMTVRLVEKRRSQPKSIGLSGYRNVDNIGGGRRRLNGDEDRPFFNSDETDVSVDFSTVRGDKVVTKKDDIEKIYRNFGLKWRIQKSGASLFGGPDGWNKVNQHNQFDHEGNPPNFETHIRNTGRTLQMITENEARADCTEQVQNSIAQNKGEKQISTNETFVNEEVRIAGCIFDTIATQNKTLALIFTEVGIDEEVEIAILANYPPSIEGNRTQTKTVMVKEEAEFTIRASDADGQVLTATFEEDNSLSNSTMDNDKFQIMENGNVNEFTVRFTGSSGSGKFKSQVKISDGVSSTLFTAITHVSVSTEVPTTAPTSQPTGTKAKKAKNPKASTKNSKALKKARGPKAGKNKNPKASNEPKQGAKSPKATSSSKNAKA